MYILLCWDVGGDGGNRVIIDQNACGLF